MNQPHAHTADPFERFDMYRNIHKAVRACMAETMLWVGRLDCADPRDVAAAMAQVRSIAAFCASHLRHEEDFVHPALEARRPGATVITESDHVHHFADCGRLAELADAVESARGQIRELTARRLYRALALFLAESLNHMDMEETDNNAVLWATHADSELLAIEHAIVASLPDDERGATMRWMLPALTPSERLALLGGVRRKAPAHVFDALLGGLEPLLAAPDWQKLCAGLHAPQALAA